MQIVCQWLVVLLLVASFFANTYVDFNGRKEKEPAGFLGFVTTCLAVSLVAAVYWGAGLFGSLTKGEMP